MHVVAWSSRLLVSVILFCSRSVLRAAFLSIWRRVAERWLLVQSREGGIWDSFGQRVLVDEELVKVADV